MGRDPEAKFDFEQLVRESAVEMRAARCWPWSHDWSRWMQSGNAAFLERVCLGCGLIKRRPLAGVCNHLWEETGGGFLKRDGLQVGTYVEQRCRHCRDVRRRDLL